MGRKQRNKQSDPPALLDSSSTKKRKLDQDPQQRKFKSKKPKRDNSNDTKIKGQRVKGKLVVPEKTRVAGKLVKSSETTRDTRKEPIIGNTKSSRSTKSTATDEDDFPSFDSYDSEDDENTDEEDDEEEDDDDEEEGEGGTKLNDSSIAAEKAALFDSDSENGGEEELADDNDDSIAAGEDDVMLTDEEDDEARGLFSDSDDEEELTAANMESMSRKLDEEAAEDQELAEKELREAGMAAPQILPGTEKETEAGENEDLTIVASRLQEIVRVLADFKTLGETGKSRIDYMKQFEKDVVTYFGYSEYLAGRFLDFFSPAEALAFFEANETPRPIVIRVNTLKTTKRDLSKALIDRGVNLGEVGKWTKCALQIFESSVPIGATPEYMAGQYILQAASSLVPVLALKPESGEKVLDMAAAPGGKTSFLSQEMKNGGIIVANEVSKRRQKSLVGNVVRMGCRNVVSVGFDGRDFGAGKAGLGGFDKVLLDAPCSGTGVIHKDPSVKTNRTEKDFQVVSQLQRQLLLSAIDSLKVDGVVVYSTCSVMIDENEMVVDYALKNRNVKLEKIEVAVGEEGLTSFKDKRFHPTMGLTKRFYPHVHNMDGFFVSRLRKVGIEKAATPAAVKGLAQAENEIEQEGAAAHDISDAEEENPFNDEEDAKLIAEGRRHELRKKGKRIGSRPDNPHSNEQPDATNGESHGGQEKSGKKEQALQSAKVLRKPSFKKKSTLKKPKVIDYSKPQVV